MRRFVRFGAVGLVVPLALGLAGTAWGQAVAEPAPAQAVAETTPAPRAHNFDRWEAVVAAYEKADRENPPPKGGIVFTGSSTMRLWDTLEADFPDHLVINRGFGGSQIVDATHFADRLIFPHEPKQIILRSGGNDLSAGKLPDEVAADFAEFVRVIRERLPNTEIVYFSFCPTPLRWGEKDKLRVLNRKIRKMALKMPRVCVTDTYGMSLDENGKARPELFRDDMLHLNAEGYKLLAEELRPYLARSARKPAPARAAD